MPTKRNIMTEECAILARMPEENRCQYVEFMQMRNVLQKMLTGAVGHMPAGWVLINNKRMWMEGDQRAHAYAYMVMIEEGHDILNLIELIRCTARAMKTIADRDGGRLNLDAEIEIEKMLVDAYNADTDDM
jgi:hypothetical protein